MNERETLVNILMDSASCPNEYARQSYEVHAAVTAVLEPIDDEPWHALDRLYRLPGAVQHRFDVKTPAARAAVVMGAVAHRAYLYDSAKNRPEWREYSEIWYGTRLARYAEQGELIASGIAPRLKTACVSVDLQAMHRQHEERLRSAKVKEKVVLTGLNGAGKTTAITAVGEFAKECGIGVTVTKFPRTTDGPFANLNKDVLSGAESMNSPAMQLMFVADALDKHVSGATLHIYDRHPIRDTLVFGPLGMETALLAAGELFTSDSVVWTFIMDRHPPSALDSVGKRKSEPRIFERKVEQMTHQLGRLAALTALPGVRWIDANFPPDEPNAVRWACARLIGSMISTGVFGRALVRQGKVGSVDEGQELVRDVFWTGEGEGKYW